MSNDSQFPEWAEKAVLPAVSILGGWLTSAFTWGRKLGKLEAKVDHLEAGGVAKGKLDVIDVHYSEVKQKLASLENTINQMQRDSRADLGQYASEDEFREAMRQQEEQWQEINRVLGHIEGYLAAMQQPRMQQPQTPSLPFSPRQPPRPKR